MSFKSQKERLERGIQEGVEPWVNGFKSQKERLELDTSASMEKEDFEFQIPEGTFGTRADG